MFTIIFSILAYQTLKTADKFTVNGFVILMPIVADCYLIIKLAEIIF